MSIVYENITFPNYNNKNKNESLKDVTIFIYIYKIIYLPNLWLLLNHRIAKNTKDLECRRSFII